MRTSLRTTNSIYCNINLVIFSSKHVNLLLLVNLMLLMKHTKLEEFCTSCSIKYSLKKQTPKIQNLLTTFKKITQNVFNRIGVYVTALSDFNKLTFKVSRYM